MWNKIILRIIKGETNIKSPFHTEGIIKSVFVLVDKDNRIGFLIVWCSKTLRGVHISRLTIPETVNSVTSDDFGKMNIPEYPNIRFEEP